MISIEIRPFSSSASFRPSVLRSAAPLPIPRKLQIRPNLEDHYMEGDNSCRISSSGVEADTSSEVQTNKALGLNLENCFVQVQGILNQNRLLINEIDQNHKSCEPDNLSRNVILIRELNTNISRVVDLYADLSVSFTKSVRGNSVPRSQGSKIGQKRSNDDDH